MWFGTYTSLLKWHTLKQGMFAVILIEQHQGHDLGFGGWEAEADSEADSEGFN